MAYQTPRKELGVRRYSLSSAFSYCGARVKACERRKQGGKRGAPPPFSPEQANDGNLDTRCDNTEEF